MKAAIFITVVVLLVAVAWATTNRQNEQVEMKLEESRRATASNQEFWGCGDCDRLEGYHFPQRQVWHTCWASHLPRIGVTRGMVKIHVRDGLLTIHTENRYEVYHPEEDCSEWIRPWPHPSRGGTDGR